MKTSSRLERIVPSLELCKLIPEGEFEDSVFVWWERPDGYFWGGWTKDGNPTGGYVDNGLQLCVHEMNKCTRNIKKRQGARIYPAPTLKEITDALAEFRKGCVKIILEKDKVDGLDNAEDLLLRQWLMENGIIKEDDNDKTNAG